MTTYDRMQEFRKWSPFSLMQTNALVDRLTMMGFFTAPASTKYHGAYDGGLFDHSLNVFKNLMKLSSTLGLSWTNGMHNSVFIVGMLHDLCKCDSYEKQPDGTYKYRTDTLLTGHGEKSVMLLHGLDLPVTEEDITCIRYHMGAFTEKEAWNSYTNAIHKYPNVLWTHTADMMAAHIDEIEKEN